MNSIVFDAGPIINLAMNNLLWVLPDLKKKFGGQFLIPNAVKKEIVDKPLSTKRFKFEALQVVHTINERILDIYTDAQVAQKAEHLLETANKCFEARGSFLKIVQAGEMETLAAAIILNSVAVVIDERTTRMLIEDPQDLAHLLEHKLNTKVKANESFIYEFQELTSKINVIRSTELLMIAYEMGLLDSLKQNIPKGTEQLVDAVLWGLKLNGCAISKREIEEIDKLYSRGKLSQ